MLWVKRTECKKFLEKTYRYGKILNQEERMKKAVLALIILSICFIPYTVNATTAGNDDSSTPGVKFEKLTID